MQRFFRLCKGIVKVRLTSSCPERFFRMCSHRGIAIHRLSCRDGVYEMEISRKDFFLLPPICRKSASRIHILRKTGLPFFFSRNKKRKAYFIGLAVGLLLLVLFSLRIWSIDIRGNRQISQPSILAFLEEHKIFCGIRKSEIDCKQVADSLRGHFPEITWVSAKIEGTSLVIEMEENREGEKTLAAGSPCDLVADKDGVIVAMITRKGVPQVAVGDVCKKGDLLVSGCLEIKNDSQETIRYAYTEADADVYVSREYSYSHREPLYEERKEYTGRTRTSFCLQWEEASLSLGLPRKDYGRFDQVKTLSPLRLTETFSLPVFAGTATQREYRVRRVKKTSRSLREASESNLRKFLEGLSEKGMKISANNVKMFLTDDFCISKGTIAVTEKIGKKVPVEYRKLPEERITGE